MAAGSLTLGGNLSIALGPLGRNGEALGSLNTSGKLSAMLVSPSSGPLSLTDSHHSPINRYSYSKTKGLFGGPSQRIHLEWRR